MDSVELGRDIAFMDLVAALLGRLGQPSDRALDIKQRIWREAMLTKQLAQATTEIARLKALVAEISLENAA